MTSTSLGAASSDRQPADMAVEPRNSGAVASRRCCAARPPPDGEVVMGDYRFQPGALSASRARPAVRPYRTATPPRSRPGCIKTCAELRHRRRAPSALRPVTPRREDKRCRRDKHEFTVFAFTKSRQAVFDALLACRAAEAEARLIKLFRRTRLADMATSGKVTKSREVLADLRAFSHF